MERRGSSLNPTPKRRVLRRYASSRKSLRSERVKLLEEVIGPELLGWILGRGTHQRAAGDRSASAVRFPAACDLGGGVDGAASRSCQAGASHPRSAAVRGGQRGCRAPMATSVPRPPSRPSVTVDQRCFNGESGNTSRLILSAAGG